LYPNKFSKCRERAEYTSAVCDNTAAVSQRNWLVTLRYPLSAQALY